MTGFAVHQGAEGDKTWNWELRGVNARGLDIRIRLPDGVGTLEANLRKTLAAQITRGNVTVNLRFGRGDSASDLTLSEPALQQVLTAMARIEQEAMEIGLSLAPANAADILGLRGVLDTQSTEALDDTLAGTLQADFKTVTDSFIAMRRAEGSALEKVLRNQIDAIAQLTQAAQDTAEARRDHMRDAMSSAMARVTASAEAHDPQRVAQELAMIAVKSDVTEEIDRLRAHVAAANDLLDAGGAVGRKLDFLTQEFNREANTLCSKAQFEGLTRIGLEIKAVIDQLREQVQNVE